MSSLHPRGGSYIPQRRRLCGRDDQVNRSQIGVIASGASADLLLTEGHPSEVLEFKPESVLLSHSLLFSQDIDEKFFGEGRIEVDGRRVQFGVKVLEPQEVPVRGKVRQYAGEKEALRFGGFTQRGRAALRQRQAEPV